MSDHDHDHDGCLCGKPVTHDETTQDDQLPQARGGVQGERKTRKPAQKSEERI